MENNTSLTALNQLIADYSLTAQNARFCHWNVVGPHFEDDHEFFGDLYTELAEEVDLFAERARAIRSTPISALAHIIELSQFTEYALPMTARQMQKNILADYEKISEEM
jgi:starvation-inducible DNA-binding protein